ncbi:PDZ domain-containing protein [uncultured Algibacter sp.]|uniref:retropepsin-like aspartic protease n=1 Tax=uncultured Algibacter sp. TaxID=298659 RepID=UPI003216DC99
MMNKYLWLIMVSFCFGNLGFSQQGFSVQNKRQSDKIKFELINNLIIIPVEVNGVKLSFLLDTGVSKPIIFNFLNISDTLKIKDTESIYLRGLGEGQSVEALKSKNNILKIGDALKLKQDLFAIFNSKLNFSNKLGVPVHGIIGYDLFRDLVVEINYSKKFLRLTNPSKFSYKTCKKCEQFNLEFYNGKPYLNAEVSIEEKNIPVKLLIDSGGSDALWLFENESLGIISGEKYFDDFLGHGLSGSVYGKRSKVKALDLKRFKLKNANVAFPETESVLLAKQIKNRNGSVSGNVLKRFNIIMDYQKALFTIKKNSYFKDKFSYNKSGIEIEHNGVRLVRELDNNSNEIKSGFSNSSSDSGGRIVFDPNYKISLKPAYTIVELRKDSPADKAGLQIGDVIINIDGKRAHLYSLQQITEILYGDAGKRIKIKVDRDGILFSTMFRLEKMF